jgi:hypothetical protein
MSIQKKSLISTLKTAKKANVASASTHEVDAKGAKVASMRVVNAKNVSAKGTSSLRAVNLKSFKTVSAKNVSAKGVKSLKSASTRMI